MKDRHQDTVRGYKSDIKWKRSVIPNVNMGVFWSFLVGISIGVAGCILVQLF